MKLTKIFFLILVLGVCANFHAQTEPTPSPTPDSDGVILRSQMTTKDIQVAGISDQTKKELDAAVQMAKEGKFEESIAAFTSVIKKFPSIMIAYNNRGSSYSDLGRFEEAINDFNTALKISPSEMT